MFPGEVAQRQSLRCKVSGIPLTALLSLSINCFYSALFGMNDPFLALQGHVLISVNPLRIADEPEVNDYVDQPLNPETPHPYAIAEVRFPALGVQTCATRHELSCRRLLLYRADSTLRSVDQAHTLRNVAAWIKRLYRELRARGSAPFVLWLRSYLVCEVRKKSQGLPRYVCTTLTNTTEVVAARQASSAVLFF